MRKHDGTLTTGQLAPLLRIPHRTVDRWIREGVITPTIEQGGRQHRYRLMIVPDCLAIATARGMRASGLSMDAAAAVMDFLMSQTEAGLLAAFARGETAVMVIGDTAMPRFVPPKAITENHHIDYAAAKQVGVMPIGVDIARVYSNLTQSLRGPSAEGLADKLAATC